MTMPPRDPAALEAYVARSAPLLGLDVPAERLPALGQAMAFLLGAADLVMEFPLPEPVEPAPEFEP